jgi:REP element-mobilizing transposase RayT
MARPLRRNVGDGWYHVFHRGTNHGAIFTDRRDREHFLELLEAARKQYRLLIHAYALMDTHYHGIIQTPEANLSSAMQWVNQSYAAWYNARHDRLGPFWQGRYRAVPVEDAAWAYELSIYVHLNPLRIKQYDLDRGSRKAESLGCGRDGLCCCEHRHEAFFG